MDFRVLFGKGLEGRSEVHADQQEKCLVRVYPDSITRQPRGGRIAESRYTVSVMRTSSPNISTIFTATVIFLVGASTR